MSGRGDWGSRGGKGQASSGDGNARGPGDQANQKRPGPRGPAGKGQGQGKGKGKSKGSSSGPIRLKPVGGGDYVIVQPREVEELELDYLEGIELWEAGEPEDACDALRFFLGACGEYLQVLVALGKIALQEKNDPKLARGHFGYAFELVERVLANGFNGRLPKDRPANVPYFEAGEGLAACYDKMEQPQDAAWVRKRIAALARGSSASKTEDRAAGDKAKPGLSGPV